MLAIGTVPLAGQEPAANSDAVESRIDKIQADWLAGQSDAQTLASLTQLEQWAAEHPAAGKLIVRMLEDPRPNIRQASLDAAIRTNAVSNPRILPLIASLHYAEPEEQYQAALFLGKFGKQAAPAVGGLVRAAQNEASHAALRWEAVFALRQIGEAGVPGLVEVLETTERSVAYKTLDSLAVLGPRAEAAYPAIVAALGNEDPHLRWRAAYVLGGLPKHARESQAHLQRALNDSDSHVRDSAAEAIGRLSNEMERR